jgi:hypothetical protein
MLGLAEGTSITSAAHFFFPAPMSRDVLKTSRTGRDCVFQDSNETSPSDDQATRMIGAQTVSVQFGPPFAPGKIIPLS